MLGVLLTALLAVSEDPQPLSDLTVCVRGLIREGHDVNGPRRSRVVGKNSFWRPVWLNRSQLKCRDRDLCFHTAEILELYRGALIS